MLTEFTRANAFYFIQFGITKQYGRITRQKERYGMALGQCGFGDQKSQRSAGGVSRPTSNMYEYFHLFCRGLCIGVTNRKEKEK